MDQNNYIWRQTDTKTDPPVAVNRIKGDITCGKFVLNVCCVYKSVVFKIK